jgi:sugar phosphate isomerase/epimerase
VSFENRSPIIVTGQVQRALRQAPGLKVTFDNGNVLMGGEDPVRAIKAYGQEIAHAHFKDWLKMAPDSAAFMPAVIGTGVVDQKGCISALKQAGYRGYLNIEYDGRDLEPEVAVRRSREYLLPLLSENS